MSPESTAASVMRDTLASLPLFNPQASTIVVDGSYASIRVEHGHLQIEDGSPDRRRVLRLSRAYSRGKRILLLAWHGIITLDAMQWCQALDIELVMFDPRMQDVILYGGKMHNDARLRRAQALATTNEHGLAITRYLLGEKISGQRDLLTLMERSVPRADELCYEIEEAASISACHRLESEAAVTYWRQWVDMPLQWHGAASRDIPAHWRTVGTRRSSRSQRSSDSQAQHAITPTHAILNYCYRLAEIET